MEIKGKWPDYIGLGMAKSGTTWVHEMLLQHPQVARCMARRDIKFCYPSEIAKDLKEKTSVEIKEIQYWNGLYYPFEHKIKHLKGYTQLFSNTVPGQIIGEITNNYLYYLQDQRIINVFWASMPDVKLFVCLRNPVDRYISHHFFQNDIGQILRDKGMDQGYYAKGEFPSLTQDIDTIKTWLKRPQIDLMTCPLAVRNYFYGCYAMGLRNLYKFFAPEQIFIIFFDDIKLNPEKLLSGLCRFLGIDEKFRFKDSHSKSNITKSEKTFSGRERLELVSLYKKPVEDLSRLLDTDLTHWIEV